MGSSPSSTITVNTPPPVQRPNPTNSKSAWITQVAMTYLNSILMGIDDNVPPVGFKISPHLIKQFYGAYTRGETVNAGPLLDELERWARWVADNWSQVGGTLAGMGWSLGTPPAQDLLDVPDQLSQRQQDVLLEAERIRAESQIEAERIRAGAMVESAQIQAGATVKAAQIAADAQIKSSQIRADADIKVAEIQRQTALETTKMQTDMEWKIFEEAERGRNRRFDLQLAEDQRQFNALLALDLYKLGIELSRNPVDWIAYQYYLGDMGVPTTAHNLLACASTFGAIPPVGPSNYGPVTGGPCTYSGDWVMSAMTGAIPTFVTIQGASQYTGLAGTGPGTFGSRFDLNQVEALLAEAREQVAGETGMQVYMAAANAGIAAVQGKLATMVTPDGALLSGPADGDVFAMLTNTELGQDQNVVAAVDSHLQSTYGLSLDEAQAFTATYRQELQEGDPYSNAVRGVAHAADQALQGGGQLEQQIWNQAGQQQQQGVPIHSPLPNPQTGLLEQIGGALGQNVQGLAGSHMLPGNWGIQGVLQNPFTQALMAGTDTPLYRTAPTQGWNRFAAVPALGGLRTGIRSGQDINFNVFSHMLPSQQEMTRGLMEATGQYWPDVVEQMMRSSPGGFSPFAPGQIGRRS